MKKSRCYIPPRADEIHSGSENQSVCPLSPMQRGMLFDYLMTDTPELDVLQVLGFLQEGIDVSGLMRAWGRVANRYPAFRTSFRWEGIDDPSQVVLPVAQIPLDFLNWNTVPQADQWENVTRFLDADRQRGFDLSQAPLARLTLIDLGRTCFALVWTLHHTLMDAESFPVLLKEVFALYDAFSTGEDLSLPPIHTCGDNPQLGHMHLAADEAFWKNLLRGFTAPTPLPAARPKRLPNETLSRRGEKETRLAEETTSALRRLASSEDVTLNTLIQAAWAILLSRYSDEEDIVFGAVRRTRSMEQEEVAGTVGLFINTLPMRAQVEDSSTLAQLLRQLRAQHLAMRPHRQTSLADMQSWIGITGRMELFKTLVVYNRHSLDEILKSQGGNWSERQFRLVESLSSIPLALYAYAEPGLLLKLIYDRAQCDEMEVAKALEHLKCLLSSMAKLPHATVRNLPMLTPEEKELLDLWNATRQPEVTSASIHDFIEQQVHKSPDAVAVVSRNREITYRELNERANALARYLQGVGVGPEVMVGIHLTRSIEMVVGVLATLKAGGAYLPLDPAYPRARLAYRLQDAQVKVVLTEAQIAGSLPPDLSCVVQVDRHTTVITQASDVSPSGGVSPENLAYVIYTSGSTGNPKGVMVAHRNVVNFFRAMDECLNHTTGTVWLAVTSLSFDISILELLWTLTKGFTVVVYPGEGVDQALEDRPEKVSRLAEYLRHYRVTHVQCTPSMARMMTMDEGCRIGLGSLRLLLIGGEPFPCDLAQELRNLTKAEIINMYGPTETTIWSSTYSLPDGEVGTQEAGPVIPLGRPVADTTFHVLDRHLQPVPPGVAGELFIGGAGVARGYLNLPLLTAERFLVNPLDPEAGARLYRTGDSVRYGTDGCLQFLGRVDHQVKIRGYRIEPAEIEQQIQRHPGIEQAVIVAYDYAPGDKRLRACVVPSPGVQLSALELREHLRGLLPEYMIPGEFTFRDSLPLTPNKKLDRKALSALCPSPSVPEVEAPPSPDGLEVEVARIWEEVLGPRGIGRDANFFDLGGNSFLAMKAHYRLRRVTSREISLTDIFRYPTVRLLAEHLGRQTASDPTVRKATERGRARRDALKQVRRIGIDMGEKN